MRNSSICPTMLFPPLAPTAKTGGSPASAWRWLSDLLPDFSGVWLRNRERNMGKNMGKNMERKMRRNLLGVLLLLTSFIPSMLYAQQNADQQIELAIEQHLQ